jgi:hypothetical protein
MWRVCAVIFSARPIPVTHSGMLLTAQSYFRCRGRERGILRSGRRARPARGGLKLPQPVKVGHSGRAGFLTYESGFGRETDSPLGEPDSNHRSRCCERSHGVPHSALRPLPRGFSFQGILGQRRVRSRLPPPGESPQTIGSAGDFTVSRSPRRSSGSARRSRASMRSARNSPASSGSWRRLSVCWHATSKAGRQKRRFQPGPRPPQRRRLLQRGSAGALRPRHQLVASAPCRPSASRSLPWQTARRSRNHGCTQGGAPEPLP